MNPLNREFQRLMSSSGWTQARTAQELRVDAGTVSRYVAGTVTPSETVLRLFAEILGERLSIGGDIVPPSRVVGARYVEDYEIKVLEALRAMPTKPRKLVCDAIQSLSEAHKRINQAEAECSTVTAPGCAEDGGDSRLDRVKAEIVAKGLAYAKPAARRGASEREARTAAVEALHGTSRVRRKTSE